MQEVVKFIYAKPERVEIAKKLRDYLRNVLSRSRGDLVTIRYGRITASLSETSYLRELLKVLCVKTGIRPVYRRKSSTGHVSACIVLTRHDAEKLLRVLDSVLSEQR